MDISYKNKNFSLYFISFICVSMHMLLIIYTGDGITSGLERAKLEHLQASMVLTTSKKIMLPRLLISTANRIARYLESMVKWVCDQLPTSSSLRKCIMESFSGQGKEKILKQINLEIMQSGFQ